MLVCAPFGHDATSVERLLTNQGYDVTLCPTIAVVAEAIDDEIGAVLVIEEALAADLRSLDRAVIGQARWSDVPFVLLAGRQAGRLERTAAIRRRLPESAINVILLDLPLAASHS